MIAVFGTGARHLKPAHRCHFGDLLWDIAERVAVVSQDQPRSAVTILDSNDKPFCIASLGERHDIPNVRLEPQCICIEIIDLPAVSGNVQFSICPLPHQIDDLNAVWRHFGIFLWDQGTKSRSRILDPKCV